LQEKFGAVFFGPPCIVNDGYSGWLLLQTLA